MKPEITTRPAELTDAQAIVGLLLERKFDATPNQDEHNLERIAWWQEHGEFAMQQDIQKSHSEPNSYFLRAASVGGAVVGYLKAMDHIEPCPIEGGPYTYAQGLMVAKSHEANGIARALARDFFAWALPLGNAICIQVAKGNEHARSIYESHGCEYVKSIPATPQSPPLDTLILPYAKLAEMARPENA